MSATARTSGKKETSKPKPGGAPKNGASTVSSLFSRFARATSRMAGRPIAFALAVLLIVGWAAVGPMFGYTEGWQLFVNTTTTIVTFLMVFLMQSTQNRDTEALQLKIDELIRAVDTADDKVIALDEAEEDELAATREKYLALANAKGGAGATGAVVGAAAGAAAEKAAGDADADEVAVGAAVAVKPPTSRRRGARAPRP